MNYADDKYLKLIDFLNETFHLNMSNYQKLSTTKYKTTDDRFLRIDVYLR